MNWFQKMFQSNFLRKLGQGIPVCLLSHSKVTIQPEEGKKKILFSLSPTPLFILQSSFPVIRLYSEIDRKTGRKGEKEGEGKGMKNQSNRTSGT